METKRDIRKKIIKLRDALTSKEQENFSRIICNKVTELPEYADAENVLCFVSYQSEVNTDSIIEKSINTGKKVFVPLVCGDDMSFYEIKSKNDLKVGYKGILEPVRNDALKYNQSEVCRDIMIMPGISFDEEVNRIGYGKGFYDRFLSKGFNGYKVAVAFDLQVLPVNSFETEETDIKPDILITDKRNIIKR